MDLGWWKGEPASCLFIPCCSWKLDIIEWGGMKYLDEQTGINQPTQTNLVQEKRTKQMDIEIKQKETNKLKMSQ